MPSIQVTPLGAGQDVGRSCIIISLGGRNVMVDCGMHMGYDDERRFPDFSYVSKSGDYTGAIDAVVISHFHLDHSGALPYFTEMCGYDGPVYMTHPTKAIVPLLLEDYRKITVERKQKTNPNTPTLPFFTSQDIANCMAKVTPIHLHQTVRVDDELEIRAYYAGHVLGAAMIHVRVGSLSCLYTGDYNMTPDRHLGAASVDRIYPDVLITETTYATTIRDSKRARESDFLKRVHECVQAGGKVLIPVFALGRAQELCILIEDYWERMRLNVPVYFSAGMTQRATEIYKKFINWTNQKLKKTFMVRNLFDYKYIRPFDKSAGDQPGGMVLFASPGMLHAGTSLEMFKKWAHDPKNMVILPGYCVPGTVGARVLAGEKEIDVDKTTRINVNLQVKHMSFSAHADAKGIMQLIAQCQPKSVVLVHGEAAKMTVLRENIVKDLGIGCFMPANGETVTIQKRPMVELDISSVLVHRALRLSTPSPFAQPDLQRPFEHDMYARMVFPDKEAVQRGERIRLEPVNNEPPCWLHFQATLHIAWTTDMSALLHTILLCMPTGERDRFARSVTSDKIGGEHHGLTLKLLDPSTLSVKWSAGLSDIVENKLLPALAENHRPLALRASVMDEDE